LCALLTYLFSNNIYKAYKKKMMMYILLLLSLLLDVEN
jgi:hypothetical protein